MSSKNTTVYAITLLVILNSGAVFFSKVHLAASIFVLVVATLVTCRPRTVQPSAFMLLVGSLLLVSANATVFSENIGGHLLLGAKIASVFLLTLSLCISRIASAYVDWVVVLGALSLPMYALGLLSPGIVRAMVPITEAWNGEYRITPIYVYGSYVFDRNAGIFWEPGAYQAILNLALAVTLFHPRVKHKGIKTFILLACVVTTFSTTGYLTTPLVFIAWWLKTGGTRSPTQVIIALCASVLALAFSLGSGTVVGKFSDGNESLSRRSLDSTSTFELMLQEPLWGWGYQNNEVLEQYFGIPDSSNSLLTLGYQFGLLALLGYLLLLSVKIRLLDTGFPSGLVLFAAILIALSTENFIFAPVFMLFWFVPRRRSRAVLDDSSSAAARRAIDRHTG